MIKVLLFIKRKPGLDHASFRAHYENIHAPLAISEMPHMCRYVRNYSAPVPGQPEPEFDVLTEMWFADQDGWHKTVAHVLDPQTGRKLAQDEESFMDRTSMRSVIVEECVSNITGAAA
jgi:uncharacterized protein (TIGR02118 family)